MAKLTLNNVGKVYPAKGGEVVALRDLEVEVGNREFVALVGPAGSGKTTALRLIAGLEQLSEGEIAIGDRRVNEVAPPDRDVAMVFQEDALYPHLSVGDNLAFGLRRRKFGEPEIRKRVSDTAAILGLEGLLAHKPAALSIEQRQRVAIARAIVRQPKVLLFDEPLAKLDRQARAQLRAEIARLRERLEATVIYATQDAAEAMALADRVVVLELGAVQQIDTPTKLYHEPGNMFVARSFGSPPINFVHGTLKQERDALVFSETGDGTIVVRLPAADRPAARDFAGKPVVLGIRSEEIELADSEKGRDDSAARFAAIIDLVEPTGAEANLHLQTGAHALICRSRGLRDARDAGRRGQFAINLEAAHLFDPATTLRII